MGKLIYIFGITLLLFSCTQETIKPTITSSSDSLSYSLGMLYASKLPENLKANHIDSISYKMFVIGIQDYIDSSQTNLISDDEAKTLTQNFISSIQNKAQIEYLESFKKNIAKGDAFLKENKEKSGVKTIKKGLQYKTIYSGWGQQKPLVEDTVLVKYKVYSIEDKLLYDSKSDSKNGVRITLDSAVNAWKEVLPLYVTGGHMMIYSSYEHAFGNSVANDFKIEPYSTVIFDVELVKFYRAEKETETTSVNTQSNNSTVVTPTARTTQTTPQVQSVPANNNSTNITNDTL